MTNKPYSQVGELDYDRPKGPQKGP